MHEIDVRVMSAGEADHGVAEFWTGGRLLGFTRIEDGDLMLRIEPHPDGGPVVVGAHSLHDALARAKALLQQY